MSVSGPMVSIQADSTMRDGMAAARKAVAARGATMVRSFLSSSIRGARTGRAENSIVVTDRSVTMITGKYTLPVVVLDNRTDMAVATSLASYGPWLEGTGSRNSTTRFKGYGSFRLAGQELDAVAASIVDKALQPYIARLNS